MPPKKAKSKFADKELVLAKMPGFPAWPSFVMPTNLVPAAILKARKKSTNLCVIFIPDGDYYWMHEKNLEVLSDDYLDKKLKKLPKTKQKPKAKKGGRTTNVMDALFASQDLDFDDFMEQLDKQRAEEDEEEDEDGEEEDEEEEEEEDDEEEDDDKGENGKQSDEEDIKQEDDEPEDKAGEYSHKDNDEAVKDESEDSETVTRHKRSRSSSINGKNKASKSNAYSPSNSAATPRLNSPRSAGSPKVLTAEEKQHQLWLCRIKLQRTLIQRNQPVTPTDPKQFPPPTADELLVARLILHRLVDFPVDVDLLKKTKIHKVLKCILKDEDLEYPQSFQLHEKCEELLAKWQSMIEGLKSEKSSRGPRSGHESRLSSQAPDDSEVSAIDAEKNSNGPKSNGSNGSGPSSAKDIKKDR